MGEGQSSTVSRILVSNVNATTWSSARFPSIPGLTLQNVSCSSSARCWAVGDNSAGRAVSLSSESDGSSWQKQVVPATISEIDYLTCPFATGCIGEGFYAAVHNAFLRMTI